MSLLALQKEKELSVCGVGSTQEMAAVGRRIAEILSLFKVYAPVAKVNTNKNVEKTGRERDGEKHLSRSQHLQLH